MSQKKVKTENNFDLNIFKERFYKLRQSFKMSQVEFADFLEIPTGSVGSYETGEKKPNSATLLKIANKCNVSSDYLLGLSEVKSTQTELRAVCDFTGLSENAVKALIAPCGIEYYPNLKETLSFLIEGLQKSEGCLLRSIYEFLNTNLSASCGVILSREKGDVLEVVNDKKDVTKTRAATQNDTQIVIGISELYEQYLKNRIMDRAIKERNAFNETQKEGEKSGNNN